MDVGKAAQTSLNERKDLEERLGREVEESVLARQRLAEATRTAEELETELAKLRRQVAEAKKAVEQIPIDAHDWSEAETRRYKIDALLAEAGWTDFVDGRDIEYEVHGMPSDSGVGFVDYVLWGEDGKPLAVVEAKRTLVDPWAGEQQAKLYADCLAAEDRTAASRVLQQRLRALALGRHPVPGATGAGLLHPRRTRLAHPTTHDPAAAVVAEHRRSDRGSPLPAASDPRDHRALRDRQATQGPGGDGHRGGAKTRAVIALADLLMRAGWVKRVLFLADRTALVHQTVNAFKAHLPDSGPVNLVTEGHEDGRVYVSTYQTMVGKIDEYRVDGTRRFGVGHFDLVVIDEAHRSVYRKYRGIFDYFDSLLVGADRHPEGRGRQEYLRPVRPRDRRAHRRLLAQ